MLSQSFHIWDEETWAQLQSSYRVVRTLVQNHLESKRVQTGQREKADFGSHNHSISTDFYLFVFLIT